MSCRRLEVGPRTRACGRVVIALAVVAFMLLAATGGLGASRDGLLTLFPLFLLIALMIVRPYAGERLIARLRDARAPRRRITCGRGSAPRLGHGTLARGGRLIAAALAGRAPPRSLAATL
jgi:hypothetical protein